MPESLKRMSWKHKNNKVHYYAINYLRQAIPSRFYYSNLEKKIKVPSVYDKDYILNRVKYYNRLTEVRPIPENSIKLSDFALSCFKKHKTQYFDSYEFTRYFNPEYSACFLFGDITTIPEYPTILKSRPINGENSNSVIMKLGKIRHFLFIRDNNDFKSKNDMLVGRFKVSQEHRARFMEMYYDNPFCDIGNVTKKGKYSGWQRPRMTIDEHLKYKFILCLEGNDVATNLKWVMSSNSIAVMPKPKYETWFMEGTLIPDYHYIQIKDDYSDVEEKLGYYIKNPEKAEEIIENAHRYVSQFKNRKQEDIISMLVLQKYFELTGQS